MRAVGLASAQGSLRQIAERGTPHAPAPLPFELADARCRVCRPTLEIPHTASGPERWNALARAALSECLGSERLSNRTPLVVSSCNGGADAFDAERWSEAFDTRRLLSGTPWEGRALPVVSGSCASGMHGLAVAAAWLEAGAGEVVLLAVDVLGRGSHRNFEALRVLSPELDAPWQPGTRGFLPGEAAVALRLVAGSDRESGLRVHGPRLDLDLAQSDGLRRVLDAAPPCDLAFGQGTGPVEVDRQELEALAVVAAGVPLASAVYAFGHTLAASSLIPLALVARGAEIALAVRETTSHRRVTGSIPRHARALIACRALGGACGAISTAGAFPTAAPIYGAPAQVPRPSIPALRAILDSAEKHRPARPPSALLVRLEHPLLPPQRVQIGGRLLPSAVLEMTPGSLALSIARVWGYAGPALCLVGALNESVPFPIAGEGSVCVACVTGAGEGRSVRWTSTGDSSAAAC